MQQGENKTSLSPGWLCPFRILTASLEGCTSSKKSAWKGARRVSAHCTPPVKPEDRLGEQRGRKKAAGQYFVLYFGQQKGSCLQCYVCRRDSSAMRNRLTLLFYFLGLELGCSRNAPCPIAACKDKLGAVLGRASCQAKHGVFCRRWPRAFIA